MSNKLKVALVQEVGDRYSQRNAFEAFNNELRTDAPRMARLLGGLLVDRPVAEADERTVAVIDTVLAETNMGSQLGFGTDAESRKLTATKGAGEWVWGEIFADDRHRKERNNYHSAEAEVRKLEELHVASLQSNAATVDEAGSSASMWEAGLEGARADALSAKRLRALTTLLIATELNLPPAELRVAVPEQVVPDAMASMVVADELAAA